MTAAEELRWLAEWFREAAGRADKPSIRAARLRAAEEMEAEAERLDVRASEQGEPQDEFDSAAADWQ